MINDNFFRFAIIHHLLLIDNIIYRLIDSISFFQAYDMNHINLKLIVQ
jgi:hypothetical protein